MKKLLLVTLFLLSSLSALAIRYVVDTKDGYANLRERADSKSKVIKKLKNNHEMVFWHEKGEWFCVGAEPDDNYSDMIDGYIHRSQVKLHPETYTVSSKDGYTNVRNEATVNSDSIAELKNGTFVTKFKEKGEWYYIEFEREDGTPFDYGYIHKSQLKKYVEKSSI